MHMSCKRVFLVAVLATHLSLLQSASDKRQLDSLLPRMRISRDRLEKRYHTSRLLATSSSVRDSADSDERSRSTDSRSAKFHSAELALANAHFLQIRTEYSCQRPRPHLVYMKDLFFALDKTYMPRCTVLHKCDDESGCCAHEGHECAPKRQQAVQLFFFAIFSNMTRTIETVTLTNHTECECRPVNHHPRSYPQSMDMENLIKDVLGSDKSEVLAVDDPVLSDVSSLNTTAVTSSTTLPPLAINEAIPSIGSPDASKKLMENESCNHMKCPAPFSSRKVTSFPLRCECDCLSDADDRCLRMKKGLQRLSGQSATCVRRGLCQEPTCDFAGPFDKMRGMCPRKSDDYDYLPHQQRKKQYGYERD